MELSFIFKYIDLNLGSNIYSSIKTGFAKPGFQIGEFHGIDKVN